MGLAELIMKGLECDFPWMEPGPKSIILAGNTWTQLGSTLRYLWQGMDRRYFRPGIRYEAGGIKGQRLAVFEIIGGPAKGGELRLGTFDAANLAGPRADLVVSDEPLPETVYNELLARLLGRNGRMFMGFTTTMKTAHKLEYLWDLVDDPEKHWVGEVNTLLDIDAVTPRGGLFEQPWMTQAEIDRFIASTSKVISDMRAGRSRYPRSGESYFSLWGPELVSDRAEIAQLGGAIPIGTPVGVGMDHGSKPGAERAVLVAVSGQGLAAHCWVLDEYKSDRRGDEFDDARGVVAMLARHGMRIQDVDQWVGDRPHAGDQWGGVKSNRRFLKAMAHVAAGHPRGRSRWMETLPKAMQQMARPRKFHGSVWDNVDELHRLMVSKGSGTHSGPRLTVAPACKHLDEDLQEWQGGKLDPHKDGIDAWRYIAVPMLEGARF